MFGRKKKKRLFVLSLDGVPFSFLRAGISAGRFPAIAELGAPVRINSVLPPISSVAWASFATGMNPGGHGIFGFIDRDPGTMHPRIPSSTDILAETIWKRLSAAGKRVIVMNVPGTYPPQDINGIMISGFLCTDLSRGVRPSSLLPRLKRLDYRIDPDPGLAAPDRGHYLEEIFRTFHSRRRAVFELMDEPWDLFMAHVMMTDRMNHFFWADGEEEEAEFHGDFWRFYGEVDRFVEEVADRLPRDAKLLLLSDHGFCRLRAEVDLNAYLVNGGFLRFTDDGEGLSRIDPSSRAYSLLPGRVYVNRAGRERFGRVVEADYDRVRDEIAAFLTELVDSTGNPVISRVFRREEVYHGKAFDRAPDLVALPNDGYDLKARFSAGEIFNDGPRSGMHTYPDAFVLLHGEQLRAGGSILDVTPTIFSLLEVPAPATFDGESLRMKGEKR